MVTTSDVIEGTVATFRQAAAANRDTPTRRGNVISLTAESGAEEVMVTADLHGNRLHFDRLLRIADLGGRERRHLVMQEVCHGGPLYPSEAGGCMSHLLLEDVARMKVRFPERFHFLLSNHEWAEVADFPITKSNKLLNLLFRCGLQEMYGDSTDRVRTALVEFIASCPLAVRVAHRVLICHSAPEKVNEAGFDVSLLERPLSENDLAPHGDIFRLLWGRDFREENAAVFAELVEADVLIHGHEPCANGFCVPNRYQVILDCCGPNASYVVLPTDRCLVQGEIVKRVRQLNQVEA